MARIRTIKPDFWTDEKVVELSFQARLLFIGMLNFVDDDGRMTFSPKKLKMLVFPADDIDVSELCDELSAQSLINIYEVAEVKYFLIRNFSKHQKIDKRVPSRLPPPDCDEKEAQMLADKRYGYIYLIQSIASKEYKIGKATSVSARVKSISNTHPQGVELLHSVRSDDYSQLEAFLHRTFAKSRLNGEWFSLNEKDIDFIKSINSELITVQRGLIENYSTTQTEFVEDSTSPTRIPPTEGKGREGNGMEKSKEATSGSPDEEIKNSPICLKTYLEQCTEKNVMPIPKPGTIFEYIEKVGIPEEWLELHWKVFKNKHTVTGAKKQRDWIATFRNSVTSNWYKIWYINADGSCVLSTVGRQAEIEYADQVAA